MSWRDGGYSVTTGIPDEEDMSGHAKNRSSAVMGAEISTEWGEKGVGGNGTRKIMQKETGPESRGQ